MNDVVANRGDMDVDPFREGRVILDLRPAVVEIDRRRIVDDPRFCPVG